MSLWDRAVALVPEGLRGQCQDSYGVKPGRSWAGWEGRKDHDEAVAVHP